MNKKDLLEFVVGFVGAILIGTASAFAVHYLYTLGSLTK